MTGKTSSRISKLLKEKKKSWKYGEGSCGRYIILRSCEFHDDRVKQMHCSFTAGKKPKEVYLSAVYRSI